MVRAFLLLLLVLTSPALAQNEQALALKFGGFPLLDPDGVLDAETKAALEARRRGLRECCGADLVIVVQQNSLSGTIAQDLALLRAQIVQAGFWTPQTLLLIYQQSPPAAVVARGSGVWVSGLRAETLTDVANHRAGAAALPSFLATIENATKQDLAARAMPVLSPTQSAALSHGIWTLAGSLAALILLIGYRRHSGLSLAQQRLDLMASHPVQSFVFPQRVLRTHEPALKQVGLLVVFGRQGMRHRGLALAIAAMVCLVGGWWLTVPPLPSGVVGLILGSLSLALLLTTPLGSWITPAPWRHQALRTALVRAALRQGQPCLLLVHRRGRLSLWQPATLPIRPSLLHIAAQRLAQDADHGTARDGLKTFVDQYSRLYRTYVRPDT